MRRRYRSLLWQWTRQLWRRPARVEIEESPRVRAGQVAITRGGHASILIRYHDLAILCDPMLGRFAAGVPRAEACGLDAGALDEVDLVLISNTASDHFHRASLAKLPRNATVVVPSGSARDLTGLGFARVLEVKPGVDFAHRSVDVATAEGKPRSIMYTLRGDGPSVFFCGASGWTSEFERIGEVHGPDIALLPIGGYSPKSFRKRHLTPAKALDAFEALRSRVFIPHRYGAFALSYETLEDPIRWLGKEIHKRDLERYVELIETGETQLMVPPRGRAITEFGGTRRPIGRSTDGDDSLEIDIQEHRDAGPESDSDYDEIEVDADLLPTSDESLHGV